MMISSPGGGRARLQRQRAYTLPELSISLTIFVMVIGAVVYSHMLGMNIYQLGAAKLGATQASRDTMNQMVADIQGSLLLYIGNVDANGNNFTRIANGNQQVGNAIQVFPTGDENHTNNCIQYFWMDDSGRKTIKRLVYSNALVSLDVSADCITNSQVFAAVDYKGTVRTNQQKNCRTIRVELDYYQVKYPRVDIGSNCLYETYQFRTMISRRVDRPFDEQ